ncbi:MAG: hypothetical protein QMD50_01860 [Patescibacteria group bacterium]|nr:hypothetical protein [Patescibacteria group bacterium]
MTKETLCVVVVIIIFFAPIAVFIGIGMSLDGFSFWEIILGLIIIAILYFGSRILISYVGEAYKKILKTKP